MYKGSLKPIGRFSCTAAFLVFLLMASRLPAQIIDTNGGMSYIWELVYGASGLNPDDDADGDGVPNRLESVAGTDPFNSNSVPRIASSAYLGASFSVSVPCVLGKSYLLQSSPVFNGGSWSNETSIVASTGVVVTLNAPVNASGKFFRVVISDVDTDGDGLTDWEERQLGLDPTKASSNGQFDGNGLPLGDYLYATNRLTAQNIITIAAANPSATVPDVDPAADTGAFLITRGGFPLRAITVQLGVSGTATENTDYAPLARPLDMPVGVSTFTSTVTPLASAAASLKSGRSVTMSVQSGAGYVVGNQNTATIVIYPTPTGKGTGLTGQYFNTASVTYGSVSNFNPATLALTRNDTNVDFYWGTGSPDPLVNPNLFSVRWRGQVQPQYSEVYTFYTRSDEGVKLFVNGQLVIDRWTTQTTNTEYSGLISLQAGVRYDIQLDYFDNTSTAEAHLMWNSPSQPKQVIPTSRLYPSASPAPASIVSPATAVAFLNQPFIYFILGSNPTTNSSIRYGTGPLPPGLTFTNTGTNGIISGIPTVAGEYQIVIGATNAVGVGVSLLDLLVIDTGNAITREVWTGIPGTSITNIPVNSQPTSTSLLTNLAGITDFGDDYGERIRGYITAPITGNYYFWIAASNTAELWISNDGEPVNKVKRASVINGTAPLNWSSEPNQKSPWLALVAGQRYYVEILHKAGTGSGDNVAVGWLRPDQTGASPSEIVPGWALSPYVPPAAGVSAGALYAATMLPEAGVVSVGVGTATLRLSPDESQAILRFSYTNLSSPFNAAHIHSEVYLNHPSDIIFDIDELQPAPSAKLPDGSYLWVIGPQGGLSKAEIVEVIKEGKAYINIHTANNGGGEIRGNFVLVNGSTTFTPPPEPPVPTDDHSSSNAAARFLIQASFGPSPTEVQAVQTAGYEAWIDDQFTRPPSYHLSEVLANSTSDPNNLYPDTLTFNAWWKRSVTAPDQLRQRVAFALSEILVVSDVGTLNNNGRILSDYYDTLLDGAFGNFRDLLKTVTLTPAMGLYLDMRANDKGDQVSGRHPNENYAREIMQLFSIGLNRMWPDGTLVLDSQGGIVPTYDQNVIMGYARVFTGWNYHQTNQANGRLPTGFGPGANYIDPMTLVPTHHELGSKRLLDNIMLPAAVGNQADSTKPEYDAYGLQELDAALDAIANNQNVGPFICRQLIQRLVTSNPSREYLYRVVRKFNDNGAGVRGDLQAVIKAILLDFDARSPVVAGLPSAGKQREPVLRVTAVARAFPPPAPINAGYAQNGSRTITVTTPTAHRLASGDNALLQFSSGGAPPANGVYSVANVTSNTFTINAGGLATGTYTQALNIVITGTNVVTDTNGVSITNVIKVTNAIITVTIGTHGLVPSNQVYLSFTTGGGSSGVYTVVTSADTSHFTATNSEAVTHAGSCLIPKLTGGYTQTRTNITVVTAGSHSLNSNDLVYIDFPPGTSPDGVYQVVGVPDATHFAIISTVSGSTPQSTITVFPLAAPPLVRSGNVTLVFSTWSVGGSDNDLTQTPLNSPTVFNYFFPDYKFPGLLSLNGLTTPEFQLTSDTGVANQMNFLYNGLMLAGNTSGFTGFKNGTGGIMLDLGPWMTAANTSTAGLPALVDSLSSILLGGPLSSSQVKASILTYANTLGYTLPTPTATQMRDRVRAVVHLLVTSPDFTIQR